jgi:glycosyltransferase involved in cell wall biosynthesis
MSVHILHVVEAFAAGTFGIVSQMANAHARDGHRVSLAYSLREETPADWREQLHPGVQPHYLPMCRSVSPVTDVRATVALARLVRELQPDIVHLHSAKAGAIGRLASLRHRRPRWYFSPHGLSFLQSSSPGRVHGVYLALERLLALTPAAIIACSRSEGALVERYLRRRPLLVPNGIPLDVVPSHTACAGKGLRVGTAGRITPARHPELFVRIARRLTCEQLRFVWLGGGSPENEAMLAEAGVEVTGWLPHAKLLEAMARLDIYLQPSRWEGLPVAVMEAMASGLPVVATDIVGNRDLVQHGRTGWLGASEDELVEGVQRLADDAPLRLRCGSEARQRVQHEHSTDSMIRRLYEAYGLSGTERQDIPTMEDARRAPYIEKHPGPSVAYRGAGLDREAK